MQTHTPAEPVGEIVMVHGLEGGGDAGYIRTLAYHALQHGLVAHRFHMRTCGNTAHLCQTLYHAGLTGDLLSFLRQLRPERPDLPIFLVGFSLGGNVVLKLAGELAEKASEWIAGVCSLSAPIDLVACTKRIAQKDNALYERRFLKRMRERLLATGRYTADELAKPRSLWEIDDAITAPSFGFGTAENYYQTQSANRFLSEIRVPALLITAQDDTFIPFRCYKHPAIQHNPCLKLIAPEHGGHLGFLAREAPRFWADETVVEWILKHIHQPSPC